MLLDILAPLKFLDMLTLAGNYGITGQLSEKCEAPLDSLQILHLSSTGVSGTLPACLFTNELYLLKVDNTNLDGSLPDMQENCPLKCDPPPADVLY